MAFKLFSDVRETSTTGGTGNQVLAGAFDASYFAFSTRYADGDTFFYVMKQGTSREIGKGTYNAGANSISRTQVYKSTNSNNLVNFTAAQTIDIFVCEIAPDDLDAAGLALIAAAQGVPGLNILDNGDFAVSERNGTTGTVTADNAHFGDRWRYLGEAANTLFARDSSILPSSGAIQFDGTTDKGGVFQVVEGINCKHLRGLQVVLSAKLKVSNVRLGNIKMGIIEFTGTEDATTGDPVSAWGADGTTPTLAANWAFITTPANLSVTTSEASYSVTGTVGASANNLAVLIWNDDKSYTAADTFYFTDVQLERGARATRFERIHISENLRRCQRYYYRRKAASITDPIGVMHAFSATQAFGKLLDFPVTMRSVPTVAVSAVSHLALFNAAGSAQAVTAADLASSNRHSISSYNGITVASGLVAGNASNLSFTSTSGWIEAAADL